MKLKTNLCFRTEEEELFSNSNELLAPAN